MMLWRASGKLGCQLDTPKLNDTIRAASDEYEIFRLEQH
jgi:hypothetical protein